MEAYLGQICAFSFNYAPPGWLPCDGRLLPISQYTALFSLLGTTYGGNGTSNFALPDMRGRSAIGATQFGGNLGGLSNVYLGEAAGLANATLLSTNLPPHTHALPTASSSGSASPSGGAPGTLTDSLGFGVQAYGPLTSTVNMSHQAVGTAGGSASFPLQNPSLGIAFFICNDGYYPQRP
jgi:microcystin-dependent protein